MKLIDNWKQAWKLKSVQVGALSAFFYALILFSEQFLSVWYLIPQELKNKIPENIAEWVGLFIGVATVLARLKKQPELHDVNQFVTITAGHSNTDPGAVRGKDKEADFVVKVRNAVELYLLRAGLEVKTDGSGGINLPLTNAIQIAKGASTKVEFHLNASDNPKANGIETIALPKDKKLAQAISQAIAGVTGGVLRGDKGWIDQSQSARGKLGFVTNGGLVVELGFLSNAAEFAVLQAKYWLVAKAIADVIIQHEKALK
ncbi:N-acetylmuramoyl-L-alanine amidase [Acinetobacter sp. YH12138]|uniref:N-acetylmuramoyl-L-alanine amidase n=1 Tax=Acinetobacter sp. YH12138 TaxID=2601122 RepID=UPI0015D26EEC|nr:N-acetylmuramoyl-L-alanine amidase [Acinetobacter sp. YH12138]QOW49281.1 N-acetylmuramoyl-L-alanine amidase [Acinetobacter sp. YH12138]